MTGERWRGRCLVGIACLGWMVLASCGGAAPSAREDVLDYREPESPVELEREQVEGLEALEQVLARPEPDCDTACGLVDTICDLETRICAIADRHPSDGATRGRCTDAHQRCVQSQARISVSCVCTP